MMKRNLFLFTLLFWGGLLGAGVADLFVEKMVVNPRSPTVKESTTLFFVIRNQGSAGMGATRAKVEIKWKNGTLVKERWVDVFALGPHKSFTGRMVMGRLSHPGSYSFELRINVDHVAGESNYSNNLGGVPVTVHGLPDLIVCYRPYYLRTNVRTSIFALVKNIGSERSEPCKLSFGLTGKGAKLLDVPSLNRGQIYRARRRVKWGTKGVRRLVLRVDPNNRIEELKENNNFGETKVRVYIIQPKYHATGYTCSDGSEEKNN